MRATSILLLCIPLIGCPTSNLGSCSKDADCSPGAVCDPSARVCIATDAPSFSAIAVTTPAGFTDSTGRAFYDTAGSPLSVSASIAGRAGVDPASVCLRLTDETGTCAHPGTAGSGNTFTFSLPRPSGAFDGTTPLDFTITASSPTARASTSAVQHVWFDNQPPSIAVAADPAAYARSLPDGGPAPITVVATISDPAGVASAQLLSAGTQTQAARSSGNTYSFQLDPADAPADAEGTYAFQIRAADGLGHVSIVDAGRTIDDAPPAIGTVKVYKGDQEPASAGVTYPPLTPNTGWTGASFIYNDTVHVKGTITDLSGVGSATVRVDGIDFDEGTTTGAAQPLACDASSPTCSFTISLQLNDPQNGAFHTGVANTGLPDGGAVIPSGFLHVIIETQDNASAFGGISAHHIATPSDTPVRATRLLWSAVLNTSSSMVTGLAVHPDLDVIATTDGGAATLYSLGAIDGTAHWSSDAGSVGGPFAIGTGEAAEARIYTANTAGVITAFAMDGGVLWSKATAKTMSVGPAVAVARVGSATVDQVIVPDDVSLNGSSLWSVTAPANTPVAQAQPADDRDHYSSPMIFDAGVWFGTSSSVDWHALTPDGGIGPSVAIADSIGYIHFGTTTDGSNVFSASQNSPNLFAFTPARELLWSKTIASRLTSELTIDIDGNLVGSDVGNSVRQYSRADGTTPANALVSGLAANGWIPLQGSDDHWYLPRVTGYLLAFHRGQLSWSFDPPGTILRGAIMDCEGRLFVGSGASANAPPTVWALVTDDHGLADTPWPSWRRDARNTGNAGAPKYGIRTAPNACNQ